MVWILVFLVLFLTALCIAWQGLFLATYLMIGGLVAVVLVIASVFLSERFGWLKTNGWVWPIMLGLGAIAYVFGLIFFLVRILNLKNLL